jgi:hypothetical protein
MYIFVYMSLRDSRFKGSGLKVQLGFRCQVSGVRIKKRPWDGGNKKRGVWLRNSIADFGFWIADLKKTSEEKK